MAKMGSVNMKGLKDFQKQLEKLQDRDAFVEACVKELAARLLRMVIKRTPVGVYGKSYVKDEDGNHVRYKAGKNKGKVKRVSVKKGGTLRRGWTGSKSQTSAKEYAEAMTINHSGNSYTVEIVNPVEYASYVEYGHRTPNHKGWVNGQFMMTISEQELEKIAPKVLEQKIKKYLTEHMK